MGERKKKCVCGMGSKREGDCVKKGERVRTFKRECVKGNVCALERGSERR